MAKLKTGPKVILIAATVGGGIFLASQAANRGLIPGLGIKESAVPEAVALPQAQEVQHVKADKELGCPSGKVIGTGIPVRAAIWAWNSQMGWVCSNGGAQTTEGSLQAKNGVTNLQFIRQDDVSLMQAGLVKFAEQLKDGVPQPTEGYHFVAIMGDGAAAFLAGVQPQLEKLGSEYTAQIIGSAGFSRGEDKFMGLPEWKMDPQAAKGALVAGYLRDGDWNIALKWAGDNGIKNNPDETTYDPEAINWVSTASYIDASKKYISGHCEDRRVVSNGKPTGENKKICVDGVVTWTPGDVMIAKEKGGLVSIASTKEYYWQMPNTIIGIKKWNRDNRKLVENMLYAMYQGGEQVKFYDSALKKAAQFSAEVYKEETAAYWAKYYKGVTEKDAQGISVELGGSSVNTLADVMNLYGLLEGSTNIFAATYTVFGNLVVSQYPEVVPSFPPVKDVLDTSYTVNISQREGVQMGTATVPDFTPGDRINDVVSKKAWTINFQTGSAEFTKSTHATLKELLDQLVVTQLKVEIHGHTDSVGDANSNMALSEKRAFAVKEYLEWNAKRNFPEGRITVHAHGQESPVAPNSTDVGRAKNRRVEIVLGN